MQLFTVTPEQFATGEMAYMAIRATRPPRKKSGKKRPMPPYVEKQVGTITPEQFLKGDAYLGQHRAYGHRSAHTKAIKPMPESAVDTLLEAADPDDPYEFLKYTKLERLLKGRGFRQNPDDPQHWELRERGNYVSVRVPETGEIQGYTLDRRPGRVTAASRQRRNVYLLIQNKGETIVDQHFTEDECYYLLHTFIHWTASGKKPIPPPQEESKLRKFRPTPYSQGPHAQAAHEGGGTLISVPLNRAKFNAMLAAYAPGCGSPVPIEGTSGTAPCGSTVGGQPVFCTHCAQQGSVAEAVVSRLLDWHEPQPGQPTGDWPDSEPPRSSWEAKRRGWNYYVDASGETVYLYGKPRPRRSASRKP